NGAPRSARAGTRQCCSIHASARSPSVGKSTMNSAGADIAQTPRTLRLRLGTFGALLAHLVDLDLAAHPSQTGRGHANVILGGGEPRQQCRWGIGRIAAHSQTHPTGHIRDQPAPLLPRPDARLRGTPCALPVGLLHVARRGDQRPIWHRSVVALGRQIGQLVTCSISPGRPLLLLGARPRVSSTSHRLSLLSSLAPLSGATRPRAVRVAYLCGRYVVGDRLTRCAPQS